MIASYGHLWGMMTTFLAPFAMSFAAMLVLVPLMIVVSQKYGILDYPSERKIHNIPVPRLGGLGIIIGFWVIALLHLPLPKASWAILVGGTIVGLMGVADDIRPLSSRIRLVGQVIAALIVLSAGLSVSFMPKLWWGQLLAWVITIFWILGIVNAVNFADGLDGLASGMVTISSIFFFLMAIYLRQSDVAMVAIFLAGCCLGFLVFNFKPAKIYLGDGGSTFIGFILACIALYGGWSNDGFVVALGIPVIILGVFIFDMIYITIARIKNGSVRSFQQWLDFTGKDHFHHRLLSLGFTEVGAVFFIYLIHIVLGLNVLVLEKLKNPLAIFIMAVQSVFVFTIILLLMRVGRGISDKKSGNV
jgi:UDP-GlcNAc:undecaprenyl-phosphate GlcNAc-1-phosphate transferase